MYVPEVELRSRGRQKRQLEDEDEENHLVIELSYKIRRQRETMKSADDNGVGRRVGCDLSSVFCPSRGPPHCQPDPSNLTLSADARMDARLTPSTSESAGVHPNMSKANSFQNGNHYWGNASENISKLLSIQRCVWSCGVTPAPDS